MVPISTRDLPNALPIVVKASNGLCPVISRMAEEISAATISAMIGPAAPSRILRPETALMSVDSRLGGRGVGGQRRAVQVWRLRRQARFLRTAGHRDTQRFGP